jgi:hypothetical protein
LASYSQFCSSLSLTLRSQRCMYAITGRAFYIIISGNKTRPSSWLFIFSARAASFSAGCCERPLYNILSTHCMVPFFPSVLWQFSIPFLLCLSIKSAPRCSNAPASREPRHHRIRKVMRLTLRCTVRAKRREDKSLFWIYWCVNVI